MKGSTSSLEENDLFDDIENEDEKEVSPQEKG